MGLWLFDPRRIWLSSLLWALPLTLLDEKNQSLLDFPLLTEHRLCDISISARVIYRVIKSLDSAKAIDPDKNPVIVLKNLNPELSLM